MSKIKIRANALLAKYTGYHVRRMRPASETASATKTATPSKPTADPATGKSQQIEGKGKSPGKRKSMPLPPSHIPVGEAKSTNFFDAYPRFFETSRTTAQPTRLNLRYEAIFGQNRAIFDGARVLDIASHDGRWSLAALETGASHVIGIEARPELVANANDNFAHYCIDTDRYQFVQGDIFEVLRDEEIKVDVVLCLGFLYHTLRYNELLGLIADCGAQHLIIDTEIHPADGPVVKVRTERTAREGNAVVDRYTIGTRVLSGQPSEKAVETMVNAYGYRIRQRSDWAALLRDNTTDDSIGIYRRGLRATFACVAGDDEQG